MTLDKELTDEVLKAEPVCLSRMLGLASGEKESWQAEELHDMLASQLEAEFEFELDHADPGLTMRMYADSKMKPEESFLNLEDMKQSESGGADDAEEKGAG